MGGDWMLAGLRVIDSGGAAGDKLEKMAGLQLFGAEVRGREAVRVHTVAG